MKSGRFNWKLVAKLVPLYLIVGGLVVLWFTNHPSVPPYAPSVGVVHAQSQADSNGPQLLEGIPTLMEIPSVGLKLSVIPGGYNPSTRQWTLTWDKAQFATQTSPVNNLAHNTLIYGHETAKVFSPTHKLQVGDNLYVTTADGLVFTYQFVGGHDVSPHDTSVLSDQSGPKVTLLTCDGIFFQYRRLMTFKFIKVTPV